MASYTILEDAYTATLKREFPHTHDILRLDLAFLMACGGGRMIPKMVKRFFLG